MRNRIDCLVVLFCLTLIPSLALAEKLLSFYGTVESFDGSALVMRTTKHSTGNWKVDGGTHVTGAIEVADWVYVQVEESGHVKQLRLEERPTSRTGVIKAVHGNVLQVASGRSTESWNLVPTTLFSGVTREELAAGDEVATKVYKNHNLAELSVLKRGVK